MEHRGAELGAERPPSGLRRSAVAQLRAAGFAAAASPSLLTPARGQAGRERTTGVDGGWEGEEEEEGDLRRPHPSSRADTRGRKTGDEPPVPGIELAAAAAAVNHRLLKEG